MIYQNAGLAELPANCKNRPKQETARRFDRSSEFPLVLRSLARSAG